MHANPANSRNVGLVTAPVIAVCRKWQSQENNIDSAKLEPEFERGDQFLDKE